MKNENEEYKMKSGTIRQLALLPPNQLIEYFSEAHPEISEVVPNIAPQIFATASNAIGFLNNKLPYYGSELPQDQIPKVNTAQERAWLDMYNTVNDPVSILKYTKDRTINSHHVESVMSVYPDVYEEIRNKVITELGDLKAKNIEIPYADRIAISKLIGIPLDSTMTQQSMQNIIGSAKGNTNTEGQLHAQSIQGKPSGPELTQINKVNNLYKTPVQRIEANKLK